MNKAKTVNILLSYYNGAQYIDEQLKSILQQTDVDVKVTIRNDGSSCPKWPELKARFSSSRNVRFYEGQNRGFVGSFCDLLDHADDDCAYFGFSDQDDVWRNDKLHRSVERLERLAQSYSTSTPMLYVCGADVVDEKLKLMRRLDIPDSLQIENVFCENSFPGHTMVFNAALRSLLTRIDPKRILCHDWFALLVAKLSGQVFVDSGYSGVLYRQHGNNVLGEPKVSSMLRNKLKGLRSVTSDKVTISKQLEYALDRMPAEVIDSSNRARLILNARQSLIGRGKLIYSNKYRRRNRLDNIIFKTQIALGYF